MTADSARRHTFSEYQSISIRQGPVQTSWSWFLADIWSGHLLRFTESWLTDHFLCQTTLQKPQANFWSPVPIYQAAQWNQDLLIQLIEYKYRKFNVSIFSYLLKFKELYTKQQNKHIFFKKMSGWNQFSISHYLCLYCVELLDISSGRKINKSHPLRSFSPTPPHMLLYLNAIHCMKSHNPALKALGTKTT